MAVDGPHRRKPATLEDVARLSGVSAAAASRALNGRDGVRPDVRDRVRLVAESLNYRPNRSARQLATGVGSVIGLIVPSDVLSIDTYSAQLVQSVTEAASHHDEGLMLLLAKTEPTESVRTTLLDGVIDGVVVNAVALGVDWVERLFDGPVPTCLIGTHPTRNDITRIEVENVESTGRLVDHILDQGYQRPAYVSGILDRVDAQQRLAGFQAAVERRHVTVPDSHVVVSDFSWQGGVRAGEHFVELPVDERPDAIITANDESAFGVLEALSRSGVHVPGDIAVAGFDGSLAARRSGLTTVGQPFDEVAELAVSAVLGMLAGHDVPLVQVVEPEVVVGTSTAPQH